MEEKEFHLNDVVEMKKQHPCGTNRWKIIRMGMDIRIKCEGCGHSVMIPRRGNGLCFLSSVQLTFLELHPAATTKINRQRSMNEVIRFMFYIPLPLYCYFMFILTKSK
jgi:hypothetical protein